MKTLVPILILSLLFAYLTEKTTTGEYGRGIRQSHQNKLFFIILVVLLTMPVGLRRIYNDTGMYISHFQDSMTLAQLLASGELHILNNPLFNIYTAFMRSLTDNYHIYFMISALFVQYAYVSFIRKYSSSFTLGIGLYICLGTYVFSFAAMKQTIAMAFLMLAIPKLLDKKYLQFYLLVLAAFFFHTYALAFVVLPLFIVKPWSIRTFILLGIVFVAMLNFEPVIGSFLDYANESGKALAEYEVFDNAQVNIFRVAVYGVVPLMSLVLKPYLFRDNDDRKYNLLIHMSIISFAFMLLGTINGANMFGRMANYFEFGIICSMSWIINKAFEKRSARTITVVAAVCFLFYFYYAYQIALDFDAEYRAISLWEFVRSLFYA